MPSQARGAADPTAGPRAAVAGRRAEVLRQSLSVGIATGAYGISFGALSVAAGLSVLQTQALSALMFTGARSSPSSGRRRRWRRVGGNRDGDPARHSQRALRAAGGDLARRSGLRRAAAAQLTIDESTAVGMVQPEPAGRRLGFWTTGLAVFVFWNARPCSGRSSAMRWATRSSGVWTPRRRPPLGCSGRLRSGEAAGVAAAAAALVAVLVAPHAPAGVPVIVASLVAVVVGLAPRRKRVAT